MYRAQKSAKIIYVIVLAIVSAFFVSVRPARATPVLNSILSAAADISVIGVPRQVRVDPSSGKIYVLGTSTTTMSVISADGSTSSNSVFSTPIITPAFADFVVSQGNVYILVSAGANGPAYKYAVGDTTANLIATHGIAAGTGDIALGIDGRLYFNKGVSLISYDTDLANRAPTTTLATAAARITFDGMGRLVYFTTTRSLRRYDLGATDVVLSSALSSYMSSKGLAASGDSSAIYFADGSGVLVKVSAGNGSVLWTQSIGSGDLSGMDFNTTTGRITTITTSGVVSTFFPINALSDVSVAPSGNSAVFSWTSGVGDSDYRGVTIRRSMTTYPASPTDGSAVTSSLVTTPFVDAGLDDGTYYYTLFNQTSDGYYSPGVTSTVSIDATPPSAPILAAERSGSSAVLTWDVPATTESFTLKRSYNDGPFVTVSTTMSASLNTYVDMGLPDGNYDYAIFALDANGNQSSPGTARTLIDTTGPSITGVYAAPSGSTSVVNWVTDEAASSQVVYSLDTSYTSTTPVTDTGGGVTRTHTVMLTRLVPCTEYNYKIISADALVNYATSTPGTFTTTGCGGGASITAATSTRADISTRSSASLTDGSATLALSAPAHFAAGHAEVIFQIKALPSTTVLENLGRPGFALRSAGSRVFDLKALANAETTVDTFDLPVQITFHYANSDIEGLSESSLWIYHYHDDAWSALENCTIDATAKTINCTTTDFSTFGLFGESAARGGGGNYASGGTATVVPVNSALPLAVVKNLSVQPVPALPEKKSRPLPIITACGFSATLRPGESNSGITKLQTFLKKQAGIYPEGLVTGYFGVATKRAVIRFQEKYAAEILKPWGLKRGTGIVSKTTTAKMCALSLE